jgi:hypothetical protein
MHAWFPGTWSMASCSGDASLLLEPSGEFCVTVVDGGGATATSFGTWEADDATSGWWRAQPTFVSPGCHPSLALDHRQFAFDGPDVLLLSIPGEDAATVRWERVPARCEP